MKQPPIQLGANAPCEGTASSAVLSPWPLCWGTGLVPFVKRICHAKKFVGSVPESRAAALCRGVCGKDGLSFVPHLGTKDWNEDGVLNIAGGIRL